MIYIKNMLQNVGNNLNMQQRSIEQKDLYNMTKKAEMEQVDAFLNKVKNH